MAEVQTRNSEVGEGVEPVETYDDALVAGYLGLKKDPLPNEVYSVTGSVARSDAFFAAPEDSGASPARRGPGRPPLKRD